LGVSVKKLNLNNHEQTLKMIEKINRVAIAQDTLKRIEQGYYTAPNGQKVDFKEDFLQAKINSQWYKGDEFESVFRERNAVLSACKSVQTHIEITPESTLDAAARLSRQYDKIFCLNFASAKNPGGGFLTGAQAQEESLARSSALYPCIQQMGMYQNNSHLKTCLYNDDMIYSPDVPVFKTDDGTLLEQYYKISILTSPAVNAGVIREREPHNISKIDAVLRVRLEKIRRLGLWRFQE
jgi:uncharacterized protein (TIGR02452 family)